MHTLDDYEVRALPPMVHGTKFFNMQGIIDAGLNAGRTFCMFNMIPHFDARAEMGQRFDDWNSLVFSILCGFMKVNRTTLKRRREEGTSTTTQLPSILRQAGH